MAQADLINLLKEYAEKRKVSHSRMAKNLGVHPNTLGQWLQGHRKLRADECERIETFLKIPKKK